jgi:hypothetical protein
MSFSRAANVALFSVAVSGRTLTHSGPLFIGDIRQRLPIAAPSVTLTGSVDSAQFDVYAQAIGGDGYQLISYPVGTATAGRTDIVQAGSVYDYPSSGSCLWIPVPGGALLPYIRIDPSGGISLIPFAAAGSSLVTVGAAPLNPIQLSLGASSSRIDALLGELRVGGLTNLILQTHGGTGAVISMLNNLMQIVQAGLTISSITQPDNGQQVVFDQSGHIRYAQNNAPTVSTGTGAGTTAAATTLAGTDQHGLLGVTTTAAPAANATVATVAYRTSYATATYAVELFPANRAAAALGSASVVLAAPTAGFSFNLTSGATPLAATTLYQWTYHVLVAA